VAFCWLNCLVLGHTKYKGVQLVYCNLFPEKQFHGSHRLDLVMILQFQNFGVGNRAFVVSPDTVWYARALLPFPSSVMTNSGPTMDPSPSIVPFYQPYQPWKHTMLLKMVLTTSVSLIMILIMCIISFIRIFSHNFFVGWLESVGC
jgi:hypothetical protein